MSIMKYGSSEIVDNHFSIFPLVYLFMKLSLSDANGAPSQINWTEVDATGSANQSRILIFPIYPSKVYIYIFRFQYSHG